MTQMTNNKNNSSPELNDPQGIDRSPVGVSEA